MTWTGAFSHVDPELIRAAASRKEDIYPHAVYREIPEANTQAKIRPWSFILHTMAGPRSTSPDALWRYVNRDDVRGESHLILGYTELYQVMPFTIRADNNASANGWWASGEYRGAVSVETQDDGSNNNIEDDPWNDFQLEHLAGVAAFLNLRYGVPLARVEEWNGRGVDGHRKFPEWSIYVGKTCPGQARWEQIPLVLEMADAIVNPKLPFLPDPIEGDPMSTAVLWRHPDYNNVFLLGAGSVINVSPALFQRYVNQGVDVVVEAHDGLLKSTLANAGMSVEDLSPRV